MTVQDIQPDEYNPYYKTYIDKVGDGELLELLYKRQEITTKFFKSLDEFKYLYRYADGKWTPLEILQHIIDTERIFYYRALRFARMDATPLIGFEHNDYINPSRANNKSMPQLIKEYDVERQHSLVLFQSLEEDVFSFKGTANGSAMTARAIAAIMIGHEKHHIEVIKERYL
ncbi:DinB family protein [Croceibacter atlanticus]|jgi:hypothetical protein|uniref:DinB family protein n=1 Tax=Croceibacter atlanticus TaxID=313588 RepID=UPI0030D8A941|tara:strand:+ start:84882 stop:85397 length:516 start_codon:yes stop_codon:yes gene_type:complete